MIAAAHPPCVVLEWNPPQSDEGIRCLLRDLAMGGGIRLAMARDPSFADALCVEGHAHDVLVGRDSLSGQIVGLGTRSVKNVHVNGVSNTTAYLGGLRARPDYRNGRDFFRAYREMSRIHRERPVRLCLTTILEENERAIRLLTSRRMALPVYYPLGSYHTLCYAPRRYPPAPATPVRPATVNDQLALLAFLRRHGPDRQFFPDYEASDFAAGRGLLRNLNWEDVLLAEDSTGVVGCLGVWDQRAYRQSWVEGYSRRLRAVRPWWNLLSTVHGHPRLPAPGRVVNHRMVAIPCVANGDPNLFRHLLQAALLRAAAQGAEHLALGLHERDPLLIEARKIRNVTLRSRLYVVAWPEDGDPRNTLDDRVPYLELGGL